jgi:hypothetical protein
MYCSCHTYTMTTAHYKTSGMEERRTIQVGQEEESASPEIGSKKPAMKSYFLHSFSWKNCRSASSSGNLSLERWFAERHWATSLQRHFNIRMAGSVKMTACILSHVKKRGGIIILKLQNQNGFFSPSPYSRLESFCRLRNTYVVRK